jgi:hypothetical protein
LTLAPRSANVVSPALAKKPAPVEGTVPSKP